MQGSYQPRVCRGSEIDAGKLREELQKAAEKASLFIWLKREDAGRMEDGALAER